MVRVSEILKKTKRVVFKTINLPTIPRAVNRGQLVIDRLGKLVLEHGIENKTMRDHVRNQFLAACFR